MPAYGFNFQWLNSREKGPVGPDQRALDFMADLGLNFARIPTNYHVWTEDFDYSHPDEKVIAYIDRYLDACRERNIQMSLNLHRAPGYCINRNITERHNLWTDTEAQDAFVFLWEYFARRYKGVESRFLSFDLLNEPPWPGSDGMNRENHEAVMRRTVAAVRAIDPDREIVLDGCGAGKLAVPELSDLDVTHSGRAYTPMAVSHYMAPWAGKNMCSIPEPVYPGTKPAGSDPADIEWNKEGLRTFYAEWRRVNDRGIPIHIGEMGCYNKTPNDVALRWFEDLFALFREWGWGYALWTFSGPFGIIEHGRPGTEYENFKGYKVDRTLLDLFLQGRSEQ